MMLKNLTMIRTSAAAIAAATVLTPGLAIAQEVDPSTTSATPVDTSAPVTAPEPVAVDVPSSVTSDPLSPTQDSVTNAPAPPVATTRGASARTVIPAPRTKSVEPKAESVLPAPVDTPSVTPVAEPLAPLAVEEAVPAPEPTAAANDDIVPIAAGAGAGLLAMLGFGMALRRRKKSVKADPLAHEPRIGRTTVDEAPATTTLTTNPRPAFAFENRGPAASASLATSGNRIEQALRGPTPDNPFLSLKKRLKRAAFFDQRDRQVRAGIAERVRPTAGLPERLVETLRPRMQPQPTQRFQWA